MKLIAALVACLSLAAQAQELFRYEMTPSGPLIAVQNLGEPERQIRVDVTFTLSGLVATDGAHIATGIGDLTRFFTRGEPPVGEGVVVGQWSGCPTSNISVIAESYYSGTVLDSSSCFALPDPSIEYILSYWVTTDYRIRIRLVQGTAVLFDYTRPWLGQHDPHMRGFFVLGLPGVGRNGPYTLSKVIAWAEDIPEPRPKR